MKKYTSSDPRKVTKKFEEVLNRDIGLLEKTANFDILYGIPKGQTKDGKNVADYARVVHDGSFSRNIPAREFLKTVKYRYGYRVKEQVSFVLSFIKKSYDVNNKLSKQEIKTILEKYISLLLINLTKNNILNGDWEENALSTIARKKSSKPLVDTGQMLSSVTSIVRAK